VSLAAAGVGGGVLRRAGGGGRGMARVTRSAFCAGTKWDINT
jgi:hypothetical protein